MKEEKTRVRKVRIIFYFYIFQKTEFTQKNESCHTDDKSFFFSLALNTVQLRLMGLPLLLQLTKRTYCDFDLFMSFREKSRDYQRLPNSHCLERKSYIKFPIVQSNIIKVFRKLYLETMNSERIYWTSDKFDLLVVRHQASTSRHH